MTSASAAQKNKICLGFLNRSCGIQKLRIRAVLGLTRLFGLLWDSGSSRSLNFRNLLLEMHKREAKMHDIMALPLLERSEPLEGKGASSFKNKNSAPMFDSRFVAIYNPYRMQPKIESKKEGHKVLEELLGPLISGKLTELPDEIKSILAAPVVGVKSIGRIDYLLVDSASIPPNVFSLVIVAPDRDAIDVKVLSYKFHASLPDRIRRSDANGWTEKFGQLVPEQFQAYLVEQGFAWDARHKEPEEPLQDPPLPKRKLDAAQVLEDVECVAECVTPECSMGLRIVEQAPYFFMSARYGESNQSLWITLKGDALTDITFRRAIEECESLGYNPIAWEEALRSFSGYFEDVALLQSEGQLAPRVELLFERLVREAAEQNDMRASITRFNNASCQDEWIRILHRRESILVALTSPSKLPCVWDQLLISVNNIGKGVLAASIATCDQEAGADVQGKRGNVFRNALRSYLVERDSWENWLEHAIDSFREHDRPDSNFPGTFGHFLHDAVEAGVLRGLRTEHIEPDFVLGRRDIRETFTERIRAAFKLCTTRIESTEEEDTLFISNTAGERIYFFVNGYGIRELRVFPPQDTDPTNNKCLLLKLEGRYQLDQYEDKLKALGEFFASGGNSAEYFFQDEDGARIYVGKGGVKVIGYMEELLRISVATGANRVQFFTVLNS